MDYLIEDNYARIRGIMFEHYINNTPSHNDSYCTNAFNIPIQHPVTGKWAYKVETIEGLPEVFRNRLVEEIFMKSDGWFL